MRFSRPFVVVIIIAALTTILWSATKHQVKNAISEAELGKKLFFDPLFSLNQTISCADCHKPEFAFADTVAFSTGFDGKKTLRNTQGLTNLGARPYFFWDGRVATLEEQAMHPVQNPLEMGMNLTEVNRRLNAKEEYVQLFKLIYGQKPTAELAAKALAAFEATLETGDSPFDKFMAGDSGAISLSAIRGREIFMEKGRCFDCHFSPDFTFDEFKNIGLFNGKNLNDSGRYVISKKPENLGSFRVPGLRNVALTAPYMHNGMFKTIEQVIDYYNEPDKFVPDHINRDTILNKPLNLNAREKSDLAAFLRSLTSAVNK